MKHLRRRLVTSVLVSVLASFAGMHAAVADTAQDIRDYPSRPVTIVVAYTPGGATDIIARVVAEKLSQVLGKSVIVVNKPGAGSNIGSDFVARAKPDGYTLLLETIANATNMSVYSNVPYNTQRDFSPIVQLSASSSILATNPALPVKNLKELIALAKAEPGKLSIASSGVGSSPHLAAELFKLRAGIDLIHVPYKGATPAMMDVMSGTVSMAFMTSLGSMPQMQKGELRPIAVASVKRLADLPDVPTTQEAGLSDFHVTSWNGLAAPMGTPDAIIQKLNKAVNNVLEMPDVKKKLAELGTTPVGGTSAEFTDYVNAETKKWAEVVKAAGISAN